jgi:regulator of sigma E protease
MMNFGFAFLVYTGVAAFWGSSEIKENRIAQVDFDRLPSGAKRLGQIESGSMLIRIGETVVNDWGDVRDGLLESPDGPLKIVTENPQGTIEIDLPKTQDERLEIFSTLSPWLDNTIGSVNPGSPAEAGGLEEGDKVLSIGGVQVENWYNMVNMIRSSPNVRLEFSLVRGGQELTRFVTPESVSEGASDVGRIGATATQPEIVYGDVGLIKAVQTGFRETVAVTGLILNSVKELFTAQVSPRELGSIFMIGQAAGQTARLGLEYYLQFVALFSVNLAILNLLPIPVLDGGHLMFLGIEAIRRKPLSLEMKLRFSQIGFFFLIAIMVLALSNDLLRLFG